jgi:DNA-directed RNA polymerase subunit L
MKIEVLENEKDKVKLEIHDNLTLVNLLNENVWKQKGVDVSAYSTQHPYLSKPVLLVKAKDPKKVILDAAEQIIEDATELKKQFKNAIK